MEKDRNEISKRILHVTLEIIRLLTGEDYTIVKKTWGEGVAFPQESGGRSRARGPITEPPSLIHEQKILELTHRMTELLTGEVPIRCQDVAVYFSMEEWEYVEGHKDLYRGEQPLMMEDQPPGLTAQDGGSDRNPPERCPRPLYSQDCPEGNVPADNQQWEGLTIIKVEDEAEEERMRGDPPCMSEVKEAPGAAIPGNPDKNAENIVLLLNYKEERGGAEQRSSGEALLPLTVHPGRHTTDLSYNPPDHEEPSPDRSHTATTGTGQRGGKRFICDECGKEFTKNSSLLTHRRSHTGEKPYSCLECGKCFSIKSQLVIHERIHTGEKPYSCAGCGRCFTNKSDLVKHERSHTGEKPYPCSECGRCFTSRSDLVKHERIHTGDQAFSCSECGKCFTSQSDLVKHRRSHTGEKPYSCSQCGKCFANNSNLNQHYRTHTGEKPFSCTECGKCFAKKSHLVTHERCHTGEKPYLCLECGKTFSDKTALVRHERIHSGEKPHSCPECGKCFIRKSQLDRHEISHTGDKPYSCSECGKCFLTKGKLTDHQRTHTGEKPYPCSECGKCFISKGALVRHERVHTAGHGEGKVAASPLRHLHTTAFWE
ncbi:oocyte zinc finger protein XlCOF22-like isoform X2 [Dendropsophus ebraccatus]